MYCPKCGIENPENAKLCQSCSQPIFAPPQMPDGKPKTSKLAIWSLVLGILTLFGGLVTAIPAIVCGIIGLGKINKSKSQLKGTGLAIAGITISLCIVMLQILVLLPALCKTRQRAQRIVCGANLAGIGKALLIYADDDKYESYPTADKWCDLLIEKADETKESFICPGSNPKIGMSSYAFNINAAGKTSSQVPLDMVLIFETAQSGWNVAGGRELLSTKNHKGEGCNILFADSHVEFVKDPNSLRWTVE